MNYFPEKFSSPPEPDTEQVNEDYHGWNIEVDRLFFANGRRALSLSSLSTVVHILEQNRRPLA